MKNVSEIPGSTHSKKTNEAKRNSKQESESKSDSKKRSEQQKDSIKAAEPEKDKKKNDEQEKSPTKGAKQKDSTIRMVRERSGSVGSLRDRNPPIGVTTQVCDCMRQALVVVVRCISNTIYCASGKTLPPIADEILIEPAIEIARQIRQKKITSVRVVTSCIKRIQDINPILKCVVEDRFETALAEARAADELVESTDAEVLATTKPFLGVPFTTKDSIAVAGIHQTAGVALRMNYVATEDAEVIRLMREAGAIVIGVTNVPELCMWYNYIIEKPYLELTKATFQLTYFKNMWETNNNVFGRTKNPYSTCRIVGGSSGGEGCIQAAAGSCFGVGADMGGSIRMPAYFCGVFGHKPSRYIVPPNGHYPPPTGEMQELFFGIGPIVRCAEDLKPLLEIMAGENSKLLNLKEPVNISNLKVYYQFRNYAPYVDIVDQEIIGLMKSVVECLQYQHKVDAVQKNIKWLSRTMPLWLNLMKHEKRVGTLIMKKCTKSLICLEILKSMIGCSSNTFVSLVTSLFEYGSPKYKSPKYEQLVKERADLETYFTEMLGDNGVFLFPTHPTSAPYHREPLVRAYNFSYTALINCLGLPATTIPLGFDRNHLPIGLQVVANHNNDRYCLAIAETLEEAFGGWTEPQSRPLPK